MILVVQLSNFSALKTVLNLFYEKPTKRVGDKRGAGNLEMMKMNIRRRLEEVSTGF